MSLKPVNVGLSEHEVQRVLAIALQKETEKSGLASPAHGPVRPRCPETHSM